MEKIIVLATHAPKSRVKHDDDFVDRLNSRYTVLILVVFTVIISLGQLGKPITCWVPKHFTGAHTKYTNSYCWVKNTYYLPLEDEIPKAHEHDKRDMILYYQWIPFILLLQALFFFLPSQVWHGLNQRGGVDADDILVYASTLEQAKKFDNRESVLRLMVNQIDRFLCTRVEETQGWKLGFRNVLNKICCGCCGKRLGSYLMVLYLITKLLYIANVIGQLFLLNLIFQTRFNSFGIDYIRGVQEGRPWMDNTHFPRVTFCDFPVRRLGNVHRYTVQCVLPLNLYLEIMYLFLWFWMIVLAVVTVTSFVVWSLRAIFSTDRLKFIMNHLKAGDRVDSDFDKKRARQFLVEYLRQDGCFLLRLMAHNTNNITVTEIVCGLWDNWLLKRDLKRNRPSDLEFGNNDDSTMKLKDEE